MASTFPNSTVKSNIVKKRLLTTPAPPFLVLFLLLLLSLLLALFLLHINHLLLHSLSPRPPLLHHFFSPLFLNNIHHQAPLSNTTLVQHYLSFLLSPFPIFILANLIIFILLVKTFYLSSSPSTSPNSSAALSDLSDFASEKFDYGGPRLPEYTVPRLEDFFLSSPPHARSPDPSEEYHVLSFKYSEQSTYFKNMQSFNKLNDEWEQVKRVYIDGSVINGVFPQKETKRQEKAQPNQDGRAAAKGAVFQNGIVPDGKTCRSLKGTASSCSSLMPAASQAVVINMEPAPMGNRRPRTSTPPSHPPPQQPTVKAPPPSTSTSMLSRQRPPSSPGTKKSLQSTSDSRSSGPSVAKGLIFETDKQATSKPSQVRRSTDQEQSNMVRSYSDQRLSQQNLRSSDVANAGLTSSSSLTNRPHVQKAHSVPRGRSAIDNLLTSSSSTATRPHMKRTQSLKGSSSSKAPSSPTFSEALDALSDADANTRFSNFIAHRFSLMKKERDVHST